MKMGRMCEPFVTLLIAGVLYSGCLVPDASAQNPQCPTRTLGDSSNACASTAFVQNALAAYVPSLTVGSTVINGGTNTRLLYDNNGILGETATLPITAFANPTNPGVNLTGSNGTAVTAMRSDAVLVLDQTIAPSMSGRWLWTTTPVFDLGAGVGSVVLGFPLNSAAQSVAAGKTLAIIRTTRTDGTNVTYTAGASAIVTNFYSDLTMALASDAASNGYGAVDHCTNSGPGTCRGAHLAGLALTGSVGATFGGVAEITPVATSSTGSAAFQLSLASTGVNDIASGISIVSTGDRFNYFIGTFIAAVNVNNAAYHWKDAGSSAAGADFLRLQSSAGVTNFNVAKAGTIGSVDAITIFNATAIPAGGTAGSGYKLSSVSNFGMFFGSGAPTLAAAQGSLYLRSDGAGGTRTYVNTNGTTGWTPLLDTGSAAGLTVGTSAITSGTTTRILYDNAGVLGEYTISGSGTVVAMQTGASLITPALGVATGTSLAIGGGSIGSDALEVTGTTTHNGGVVVAGAPWTLSGNQSVAAWTTNGVRIKGVTGTLTDTTSSGTVATAYTDVLGGNTIAASAGTTYTNYFSMYLKAPVQGTNVTFTNSWAIGADSAKFGTSNQVTISLTGVLTATSPVFTTPTLGAASATSVALALGAVATPSLTFTGDLNTGIWSPGADNLSISTGGTEAIRVNSTQQVFIGSPGTTLVGTESLMVKGFLTVGTTGTGLGFFLGDAGSGTALIGGLSNVAVELRANNVAVINFMPAKHLAPQGTAPALTSCGTGSPAITGTDTAGEVTMGTNATGCIITFNVTYASAPYCAVSFQNTPLVSESYSVSATAITTVQTSTSGNKLSYVCMARTGGWLFKKDLDPANDNEPMWINKAA